MGTGCACDLNFNTCSLWDPFTPWTCSKWTTNLSSVPPIISSATASVSAYNFRTLCSSVWYIHNFRDLYVGNTMARSTHTQITLEIDLGGHDCQTHHGEYARLHLLYLGLHRPAVKMFCALVPPPRDDWNDSLCSSCHFYRLLTVLSQWSVH